jgi:ribonuclease R
MREGSVKKQRRTAGPPAEPGLPAGFPTRDEIARYIAESPEPLDRREIARAFNIPAGQRIWLKRLLRELEDEGRYDRHGRNRQASAELPPVLVARIVEVEPDGDLIAVPASAEGESAARIRLPYRPAGRDEAPAAGKGDRVLVRVREIGRGEDEGAPTHEGRVIKVLPRDRREALGIFRALAGGGGRVTPVDKKALGREYVVRPGDEAGAKDGDLVTLSVDDARDDRPVRSRGGRGRGGMDRDLAPTRARVSERLGNMTSERAASMIAIHAHDIPHVFPPEVLAEAQAAPAASLEGREDWRDLPLLTIDPADAKDHDDAVHASPDTDPANPGGFVLTVAIADVAAYIRPGSALDREALKRGNSVYFPDRVVPMLPERISNDLCSLRPDEDRPALAVRIVIDAKGHKRRHAFHRIMMRSRAKLAYEQAQAAIDGYPDAVTTPLMDDILKPLWAAYRALSTARDSREPLLLDLPERKILLKPDGTVDRVIVPQRLDAHRLIEEFMILANVCAAETLEERGSPLLYRVHDEPSLEKMRALGEVLASVGLKLPKSGALQSALFNRVLKAVEGGEHQAFVNEVVLRTQAQAEYAAENYGHFGLNLRRYAHFTSPIRRYADLIVHRGLIAALSLGSDGLPKNMTRETLKEIGESISQAERRAMAAERDTIDRLIAHHLSERIGETFEGRIAGVTRAGLFVKLEGTGADGFVPVSTLGADYFTVDEALHALIGQRTGETHRLGDNVTVRLAEAAPVAGALRFELLSEGKARADARSSGPRRVRRTGPAPGRQRRR